MRVSYPSKITKKALIISVKKQARNRDTKIQIEKE